MTTEKAPRDSSTAIRTSSSAGTPRLAKRDEEVLAGQSGSTEPCGLHVAVDDEHHR